MNFPLEQTELYNLPKDMLIKLILTMQKQYEPKNVKDDKIVEEARRYVLETYKRKSIVIKEYLQRYDELAEVLPYVKTFKLKLKTTIVILSLSFIDGRFIRYGKDHRFCLVCFDSKFQKVYTYISGIEAVPNPVEQVFQEEEMSICKKYIDFVKFLHEKELMIKLFDYLNFYNNKKSFE